MKKIFLNVFLIVLMISNLSFAQQCSNLKTDNSKEVKIDKIEDSIDFSLSDKEKIDCNLKFKIEKNIFECNMHSNTNLNKVNLKAVVLDSNYDKSKKEIERLKKDDIDFKLFTETGDDIELVKIDIVVTKDNKIYVKRLELEINETKYKNKDNKKKLMRTYFVKQEESLRYYIVCAESIQSLTVDYQINKDNNVLKSYKKDFVNVNYVENTVDLKNILDFNKFKLGLNLRNGEYTDFVNTNLYPL